MGGRLRYAPLPYRIRHPILLASHPLVHLIALQAHHRTLHGGPQLTVGILRQEFWIIRARSIVKAVIHRCIVCVRERAAIPVQLMGDLPKMRVLLPPRSFAHCGIDYGGPVKVRASATRGITSRKSLYRSIYLLSHACHSLGTGRRLFYPVIFKCIQAILFTSRPSALDVLGQRHYFR